MRKRYIDNKRLDSNKLYHEYLEGKQTIQQLAKRHRLSSRTISRYLEKHTIKTELRQYGKDVI